MKPGPEGEREDLGLDLGSYELPEGAELVPEEIELKSRDTGPAEILAEEMTSLAT